MTDLNKLRRLAGVPVDLSKVDNARATIVTPTHLQNLKEHSKVPQHRGELSPKNKKNMRQRVSCAKKALEALEMAREELMQLPAVDYDENIPDVIRQLHKMLHGEDGTGGLHSHHREYEREYNDMEFPEDLENTEPGEDGNPTQEELDTKEKESAKKKKENEKKKSVKEGVQAVDKMLQGKNALTNSVQSTAGEMEGEGNNTADANSEQEEDEQFDVSAGTRSSRGRTLARSGSGGDKINPEAVKAAKEAGVAQKELTKNPFKEEEEKKDELSKFKRKNPFARSEEEENTKPTWLTKAERNAESDKKKKKDEDEEDCAMSSPMVGEAAGQSRAIFPKDKNKDWVKPGSDLDKKFAADADLNKNPSSSLAGEEPGNVFKSKQDDLMYPKTTHDEGPNQLQTNPYNESQKVHVPTAIKSALKAEADEAQKNADMFLSRKDLDSKNFYEDMAKAFTELHMRLDEGTLYSMKQAQILMTSMMSIFTNKIPPDVVKFIAAGGTVRPLKDYFKPVSGNFDEWHIHPTK